ncbi:MAG: ribosomal protein L7/L12 [Sphingobium sp.]|nr:ribosomal protein L7/L12 [Sphingobium sp.]
MYISMPVLIGAAIAIIVIFLLLLRRASGGARRQNELMGIDNDHFSKGVPSAPQLAALTPEIEGEIREMVAAGKKIEAIRLARETTGMGLKEAKEYVERL